MADYKYAFNGEQENTARAVLKDAAISTKTAIEMSNFLRGKSTKAAKATLERIVEKKQALPFKRFTNGLGHRKGPLASGRYPQKASQAFLALIANAETNASHKGLSDELIIKHLAANKASTPYHYGRQRRRKMKRTHVEIVLVEDEQAKAKAKPKKKAAAEKTVEAPKPAGEHKTQPKQAETPKPAKPKAIKQAAEAPKTEQSPSQEKENAQP